MPAKFINGPLGNGLSFFLGQAQAQPLHDLPCPDQGVADAVREEVATGDRAIEEQSKSSDPSLLAPPLGQDPRNGKDDRSDDRSAT